MANPLLEAALAYAAKGWPVFPCNPSGTLNREGKDASKEPIGWLVPNGVLDASTDEKTIQGWWSAVPAANIAFSPGSVGLAVLDFDPGSDRTGLLQRLGLGPTSLVQQSPRGGTHEFYELAEGEVVSSTASRIAEKVDVRSFHGYILLAPSKTPSGTYSWLRDGAAGQRSDEFVKAANTAKARSDLHDTWLIEPDQPQHVARAIDWLQNKAKISVEGEGGDSNAYATAAYLKSLGVAEDTAFDLMWEHWNPRCDPPWTDGEYEHLRAKVEHGYRYNTSPPGNMTDAYHLARKTSIITPISATTLPTGREFSAGRFRFVDRDGMDNIQPPEWLIEDTFHKSADATLWGASGTFKSFIALDMALTIASGGNFPWEGMWKATIQGPVLYAAGEGRSGITARVAAWEKRHNGGKKVVDFILTDPVPTAAEEYQAFLDGAKTMRPEGYALTVIDTVGRSMYGSDENAAKDASLYSQMTADIRDQLGCATLSIMHSGHDDARERGSSVFRTNVDTSLKSEREGKEMAATISMSKQKDGQEWLRPRRVLMQELDKTLVAVAAKEPAKPGPKPADIEALIVSNTLDGVVMRVLGSNPGRQWSTRELAAAVAHQPEIEIDSKTLQNTHLRALREDKGTKAHRCFDPLLPARNGQWRYKA